MDYGKPSDCKEAWIQKQHCGQPFTFSDSSSLNLFSGSWKEKKFKPYNFEAMGVPPDCGHLHPLMKVRTQFRQIFLEMG